MQTKVRAIYSGSLISAAPTDRLIDVTARMLDTGVAAIPVMAENRLLGIVTEHDVLRAVVDGMSPRVTEVSRCMTGRVCPGWPGSVSRPL